MTINEQVRLFIAFIGVGNLLEESGLKSEDIGFTEDEMARVVSIVDRIAPNDELPPEYLAEAKLLFRESLDAFLSLEVTQPATEN